MPVPYTRSPSIPRSYQDATLHGGTPADPFTGERGIALRMADGTILRLRLQRTDAHALRELLDPAYLGTPLESAVQSLRSSGSPMADGSPKDGHHV